MYASLSEDSRNLHRTRFDWSHAALSRKHGTLEHTIWKGIQQLREMRARPCFAADARVQTLDSGNQAVLAVRREKEDDLMTALMNFSEQAQRAIDAGAKFLVCAGFSRRIVEFAVLHRFPIFPGVCTPTELLLLLEYDLPVAKFFPAAQYGGLATIKALSAPFPQVQFMPTGGISAENVREYLEFPKVIACGGSWMVKSDLINAGEFDTIRRLTQEAVDLVVDL